MDTEVILNIQTTKDIADDLQQGKATDLNIETVEYTNEQTSRFGVVEIASIVGIAKTVLDVLKIAIDIRNLLKKKGDQTAQINASGQRTYVIIKGDMTNEELENAIGNHFKN